MKMKMKMEMEVEMVTVTEDVTQSKSKTIITRQMGVIIIFTDHYYGHHIIYIHITVFLFHINVTKSLYER